ncbi:hypothetical protein [Paraburkholderia lacunae]|uniref:Uncharacterized protein n=1 Tax=Paraburkholderia lacunae TaxID=2211104 RepID=A0A370N660_9BURK|nr:hypothetical protein [Paraburkholderia lacunae]RDK01072.1 hypothetical protein DLM46_19945 [Paraburkholderia lacunae]
MNTDSDGAMLSQQHSCGPRSLASGEADYVSGVTVAATDVTPVSQLSERSPGKTGVPFSGDAAVCCRAT